METKKEFKYFTIFEYEKEQDYLRSMHKLGWKFQKVTGLGVFHFQRCQPEDVIYQLDYNKEGLANKDEYVKMFTDCGWEYLQDYVGYSYFRKAADSTDGASEIFFDDDSRLEMMKRVLRGRMLPLLILFSLVLVPQFFHLYARGNYGIATFYGIILGVYISIFITCMVQYRKYSRK